MVSWRSMHIPALGLALASLTLACVMQGRDSAQQKLWWAGFGPVLPHDTFPGDCSLCHTGNDWQKVSADFAFDHFAETGVPLNGAHERATCLRCHNDRGPVAVFTARGCAGCHEDVHRGQLGSRCVDCHTELTWLPFGQYELHSRLGFQLIGAHASTACYRCHPGAEVGRFVPTDRECVTCHVSDLARALNPNHFATGWTDRCDRCHLPRTWSQAELNP